MIGKDKQNKISNTGKKLSIKLVNSLSKKKDGKRCGPLIDD